MAPRLTVVLLLLALPTACATAPVVRLDTGRGEPLEYRPTASTPPLKVGVGAFEESLSSLVLELPLSLRPAEPGELVRASHSGDDADTSPGR
jgi:hypothetical protein